MRMKRNSPRSRLFTILFIRAELFQERFVLNEQAMVENKGEVLRIQKKSSAWTFLIIIISIMEGCQYSTRTSRSCSLLLPSES